MNSLQSGRKQMTHSLSWNEFQKYKVSPATPATLRRADVQRMLATLAEQRPAAMELQELGTSVEGRSIEQATLGTGPLRVMLWSQMHGNEPTHTAVLLDLISFLQTDPSHRIAAAILDSLTIRMIPMLNPDGAERWQRQTARGIDMNRDAVALVSPEARILQTAVEEFRPDFGFNLHDQHRRSAVSSTLESASISLLVPSPDDTNELNSAGERARLVASSLLDAIAEHCPGSVSRYRADYMPRAFGESFQRQGISTLLIEAGRWADHSDAELVHLHWMGVLAALNSIATGQYQDADPEAYDQLPLSHPHRLFDLLVRGATIFNGEHSAPLRADLGINREHEMPTEADPATLHAAIDEIGDLGVTDGIDTLEGDLFCLPGKIVFNPKITPTTIPANESLNGLLAMGVTTLIGQVDIRIQEEVEAFLDLVNQPKSFPVNLGFVGTIESSAKQVPGNLDSDTWIRLSQAVLGGVLAIVCDDLPADVERTLKPTVIPIVKSSTLTNLAQDSCDKNMEHELLRSNELAGLLNLGAKGKIARGSDADLVLFDKPVSDDLGDLQPGCKPRHVVVRGGHAICEGHADGQLWGTLITRSETTRTNGNC